MKCASGQSTDANPAAACEGAYAALHERLGGVPDILYVAWSVAYPGAELLQRLRELCPDARIHGATSCLGGMTEEGFISDQGRGLTLFGISDPHGAYGVGGEESGPSAREAASRALIAALEDAGRPGEVPSMVRVTASPGAEEEVIAGIEEVLGHSVPIIGGSAADNTVEGHWELIANDTLLHEAVVLSVLFPSVHAMSTFHSGYMPTDTVGTVTRAAGRTIHEIDHRPAAVVYDEWTGGTVRPALDGGGNVLSMTTLHPLGRVVGQIGNIPYYQLSHPDGVTPDGALTLFSNIETGAEVTLMEGSVDGLVRRAGAVVRSAIESSGLEADRISGAMVVYCAGCMLTVREQMDDVAAGIRDQLPGVPFTGTFTFGEQGCFVGGENRHGNLMISVTVFGS